VIVDAAAAGLVVHELIGHALEADAVRQGTSLVASLAGTRVTDAAVTVLDGGAPPGTWGCPPVDDEGTANLATLLLDRGVFVGTVTDRLHADAAETTGNGRRASYEHPVLPRASCTRLMPGTASLAHLVADLADGLLVTAVDGGAVDARTGLLNVVVREGVAIRSGQPAGVVGGLTLVADARTALAAITGVGDRPTTHAMLCGKHGQLVPVSASSPALRFDGFQVIGG
jgi:TldD protein